MIACPDFSGEMPEARARRKVSDERQVHSKFRIFYTIKHLDICQDVFIIDI
jgi:hypothetical protein